MQTYFFHGTTHKSDFRNIPAHSVTTGQGNLTASTVKIQPPTVNVINQGLNAKNKDKANVNKKLTINGPSNVVSDVKNNEQDSMMSNNMESSIINKSAQGIDPGKLKNVADQEKVKQNRESSNSQGTKRSNRNKKNEGVGFQNIVRTEQNGSIVPSEIVPQKHVTK